MTPAKINAAFFIIRKQMVFVLLALLADFDLRCTIVHKWFT